MHMPLERRLAIAGTYNLRDLGGYALPGGTTRWRRVLRADGLHRLDADGIAEVKRLGVTTVIDLRRDEEMKNQPNPFRNENGVHYRNLSLFEALAPSSMAAGNALYDLYIQALASRGERIIEVMSAIADAPEGIVLFHCTAGKDRTGLIAALLLGLVGVDDATIIEDYSLTKALIAPAVEGFIADAESRGVDPEGFLPLLACEPETMADTLAHLARHHGSIPAYLERIGLDRSAARRLRARIAEEA